MRGKVKVNGRVSIQILQVLRILDDDLVSRLDEISDLLARLDELVDRIGPRNSCIVREALTLWLAEEQRRYELTL